MNAAVLTEDRAELDAIRSEVRMPERSRVQEEWAAKSVRDRVHLLRLARHRLARLAPQLAQAISPGLARTQADTRVAEILPLLAACRFLEQRATKILAPQRLGKSGLPFWLAGVDSEVHRVPLGHVLVIGPANYPLFLPGVQALQALAAGNAVTWKPGRGGRPVAALFAQALEDEGLPDGLLRVTDERVEAAQAALAEAPSKVFFTGSAEVGRVLMRQLAETLTPSVMELSGCDAVIVLPSADLHRVARALAFGMRLNGSATCMAPRRVLMLNADPRRREDLIAYLQTAFETIEAVALPDTVHRQLDFLLAEAEHAGAHIHRDLRPDGIRPIIVTGVQPEMRLAQADIFAPVLSILDVPDELALITAQDCCPYALTTAIFGDEQIARRLATRIITGTVMINDLIVPTADPRLPFGGRRQSGFGVTRGAEGLLEMTAVKTIVARRGTSLRHYQKTGTEHEGLFDGLIAAAHAGSWTERFKGIRQVASAGKKLQGKGEDHDGGQRK